MRCNMLVTVILAVLALSACAAWAAAQQAQGTVEKSAEEQIAAVRDTMVDALWLKTDEYWHGGDVAPVTGICRMINELDPHFVEAYSVAAWVYMQEGKDKEALAMYKEGIARNPDSVELLHEVGLQYYMVHKRDPKGALPYLKRVAEMKAPVTMKRTYAHALKRAGMPKEAAAEWFKILKEFPGDPIAIKELQKLHAETAPGKER